MLPHIFPPSYLRHMLPLSDWSSDWALGYRAKEFGNGSLGFCLRSKCVNISSRYEVRISIYKLRIIDRSPID